MKLLATAALAVALLACPAFAQDKKGYDLGQCGADQFLGAYAIITSAGLELQSVSEGPNRIEPVDPKMFYKFKSEDKDGKHYEYVMESKKKLEIVLDFKASLGYFNVDGKMNSVFFIAEDEDGSKLSETTIKMFEACKEFNKLVEEDKPAEVKGVSKT
jgi:hypothetical protein